MTIEELKQLISMGEKIDVEFKKSENDLNKDVYQSVCSFNFELLRILKLLFQKE